MKKNQGLVLRQLNEKLYILDVIKDLAPRDFNQVVTFNSSTAFLWQNIDDDDITEENLAKLLVDKYDVDIDLARKDSEEIIKQWLAAGLIF